MKVDVDTISTLPDGLLLGAVITGPEDSWKRFTTIVVPWGLVTYELLQAIEENMSRTWREEAETDGLF